MQRTASDLDAQVRGLSLLLARHELDLSRALLSFHRADGWRRLGYATESQYARERLGLSRSSLLARRGLALKLEALPAIALALGAAQIGVEAALQVVRFATPRTERAWLERAQRRTVKHLREEVSAALVALRLSGELDCPPPREAELEAYAELERAVLSGRACKERAESAERLSFLAACGSVERRAWHEMLASLQGWLKSGVAGSLQMPVRMSAARSRSSAGRVEVRLRVPRHLFSWWRGLEAQARRHLPPGMSWLKFLCLSVWSAWARSWPTAPSTCAMCTAAGARSARVAMSRRTTCAFDPRAAGKRPRIWPRSAAGVTCSASTVDVSAHRERRRAFTGSSGR